MRWRKDQVYLRAGVNLPPGELVYAIGDIHGRVDLLDEIHGLIEEDAAGRPAARRTVVYLGDYVDRGPDSRAVIDLLLDTPLAGFESVHLLGNHEEFLLGFLADESMGEPWMLNGGTATLASYGVDPFARYTGDSPMAQLRLALSQVLPERHLAFLQQLAISHQIGDYLFVHAGIRPGVGLDAQTRDDMLWIRDPFLDSQEWHGVIVVHGHSIRRRPERKPNRIGIDTGAYVSDQLTALVLEATEDGVSERFLQT